MLSTVVASSWAAGARQGRGGAAKCGAVVWLARVGLWPGTVLGMVNEQQQHGMASFGLATVRMGLTGPAQKTCSRPALAAHLSCIVVDRPVLTDSAAETSLAPTGLPNSTLERHPARPPNPPVVLLAAAAALG